MKKVIFLLVMLLFVSNVRYVRANTSLNDGEVLEKYFNMNNEEFVDWYNTLTQDDKNQVLAGGVVFCNAEKVRLSLENGGDVNTKMIATSINPGHGGSVLFIRSGLNFDNEKLKEFGNDAVTESESKITKEDCGDIFSMVDSLIKNGVSLAEAGVEFCSQKGNFSLLIDVLEKSGANVFNEDVLIEGILQNNIDIVKKNIKKVKITKLASVFRSLDYIYTDDRYDIKESRRKMIDVILPYLSKDHLSKDCETIAFFEAMHARSEEVKELANLLKLEPDINSKAAKEAFIRYSGEHGYFGYLFKKYDIVKFLINNGVDINYKDKEGRSALNRIMKENKYFNEDDIELAKLLIDKGIEIKGDEFDNVAYQFARLHEEGLRRFDANHELAEYSIKIALDNNDCDVVEAYVDGGYSVFNDIMGSSLFERLLEEEQKECFLKIIEKDIDWDKKIDKDGYNALELANKYFWSKWAVPYIEEKMKEKGI